MLQILLFNCMEVRDPQVLLPHLVNACSSSGRAALNTNIKITLSFSFLEELIGFMFYLWESSYKLYLFSTHELHCSMSWVFFFHHFASFSLSLYSTSPRLKKGHSSQTKFPICIFSSSSTRIILYGHYFFTSSQIITIKVLSFLSNYPHHLFLLNRLVEVKIFCVKSIGCTTSLVINMHHAGL